MNFFKKPSNMVDRQRGAMSAGVIIGIVVVAIIILIGGYFIISGGGSQAPVVETAEHGHDADDDHVDGDTHE